MFSHRNPTVIGNNHDKQVFSSRKLRVENFPGIIKIATILSKQRLKTPKSYKD